MFLIKMSPNLQGWQQLTKQCMDLGPLKYIKKILGLVCPFKNVNFHISYGCNTFLSELLIVFSMMRSKVEYSHEVRFPEKTPDLLYVFYDDCYRLILKVKVTQFTGIQIKNQNSSTPS